MPAYSGPTRDEPLAVELYNTLYALRGHGRDGLVDAPALRGWLSAVGDRLPVPARSVDASRLDDVRALRAAVREALEACVEARPMDAAALDALNAFSARASRSLELRQRGARREARPRYYAPTATDVALGAIAEDAIALVTGAQATYLHRCGAPGCVLMFIADHPRRRWCSTACGNRARQARHYARSRRA